MARRHPLLCSVGDQWAPTELPDLLGGIHQMTDFEIIIDILRCLSNGLRVGLLCAIM